jgi:DinB superfamily
MCEPVGVSDPAAVARDNRDWTFVITEGCGECGFRPMPPERTGQRLREAIPTWRKVLASTCASQRPAPTVWSPVEYGCHVRDTSRLFRQRLELMLAQDDPEFDNWDQDVTAVEDDYFHQDPTEVAAALADEAEATAAAFDTVRSDQWDRPGRRSNGSTFTIGTFAIYFLHDIEHHVHDVAPA